MKFFSYTIGILMLLIAVTAVAISHDSGVMVNSGHTPPHAAQYSH